MIELVRKHNLVRELKETLLCLKHNIHFNIISLAGKIPANDIIFIIFLSLYSNIGIKKNINTKGYLLCYH